VFRGQKIQNSCVNAFVFKNKNEQLNPALQLTPTAENSVGKIEVYCMVDKKFFRFDSLVKS